MSKCCQLTFTDYLGNCAYGAFYIVAPLTAGETYYWRITDKFGNMYTGSSISDGEHLPIDIDVLPEGLLNKYAGQFLVEVFSDVNYIKRVPLLMARYYDGVVFDVQNTTQNKDFLGEQFVSGSESIYVSVDPPSDPSEGDIWLDV